MSTHVLRNSETFPQSNDFPSIAGLARRGHWELSVHEAAGLLLSAREVAQAGECAFVIRSSMEAAALAAAWDVGLTCGATNRPPIDYAELGTGYVSALSSRELVAMAEWCDEAYDIEDYASVLDHLSRYPELMLPLRLIPDRTSVLRATLSRPRLRMVIEDDPVSSSFLVAAVPTILDVLDASRILDDIDEAWWSEQSRSLNGRLVLTVDYL